MVRLKTRWILARLEFQSDTNNSTTTTTGTNPASAASALLLLHKTKARSFPSHKELFFALHDAHLENFGLAATGEAKELQVRFSDPATQLVLIRVARTAGARIRCTLTLMTNLIDRHVTIRILSVHGNVRTAKTAAIHHVRNAYHADFHQQAAAQKRTDEPKHDTHNKDSTMVDDNQRQPNAVASVEATTTTRKLCAQLEASLAEIHAIDF
mmetsp:Transcript_1177/g.2342  ORF Transcript_1177/g.2342 Transcript_1177/m.2342 type:complete len:211 (-) Transcript_1177:72-704(-)|eukprot:CAMPEP_0168732812 /NCGR_PEP_ID=MMETSP0724-20121128/7960_1 /TAXON_ID=265536 /ORGANISM="Amphiprora sp., Strain CCMP467" /LENGTH=210 /DNA_ID=CAMNT_0008779835 /DNA_START=170 /DNA_END=802 /DNA_ORIENTATION=-